MATASTAKNIIDTLIENGITVNPPAPTGGKVDDALNTFTFVAANGYNVTAHEYSINNSPYRDCTTSTIKVGDVTIPVGGFKVRVKAGPFRNAGAVLTNATAFTATAPVPPTPPKPEPIPVNNNSFTLKSEANTSAGVYKPDGTRVRNLWSGEKKQAGTYTVYWDGKLDDGTTAPSDNYSVKVLTNNVSVEWEGAIIGNTGNPVTGPKKLRGFEATRGVAFVGDNAFWALGYMEAWPSNFTTSVANPEAGKTWFDRIGETNATSEKVATDGNIVYYAGADPIQDGSGIKSFVFGLNAVTKQRVPFPAGVKMKMNWGSTYDNAIATSNAPNSTITGLAVQKNGPFLFVTRAGLNELKVLNKTTGALVQTVPIISAGVICVDTSDNIWIAHGTTIERYTVSNTGAITSTGITITGITAGGIDVSPDGLTVAICDMDSQVLKGYTTANGALVWTHGTPGGYFADATVTNLKYYWKDVNGIKTAFVKYLPDGGFYLGDGYNERTLVFDAKRNFVKQIAWKGANYYVWCDKKNPSRVFCDMKEYSVDYTKPLGANNESWMLTKNWGANYNSYQFDYFQKITNLVTLSNGRTYGTARRLGAGENEWNALLELVQGGTIRNTGIILHQFDVIQEDGSIIRTTNTFGGQTTFSVTRKLLTGFDANNNPVWGNAITIVNNAASNPIPVIYKMAKDKIVFFDIMAQDKPNNSDHHLGAVKIDDNKWLYRTAKGTSRDYTGPLPDDGAFDNGNGVNVGLNGAGGFMDTFNNVVIWNYHGEFWKQSQTNKYNLVDVDTGLFAAQFGKIGLDYFREEAASEGEGNVISGSLVEVNGTLYLYTNGEWSGLHRWKITGIDTIQTQTITPKIGVEPQTSINLLAGITRAISTLPDNFNGWTRTPSTDVNDATGQITTTTGKKSYDPFKQTDLSLYFSRRSGSTSIKRDLGNNNLSSWSIKGLVSFDYNQYTDAELRGGSFIRVKDSNDKVIAQFDFRQAANYNESIMFNNQVVHTTPNALSLKLSKQPIEITNNNGTLIFNYAGYTLSTATTQDPTANKNNPKYFEWYCYTNLVSNESDRARFLTLHELRFFNLNL